MAETSRWVVAGEPRSEDLPFFDIPELGQLPCRELDWVTIHEEVQEQLREAFRRWGDDE